MKQAEKDARAAVDAAEEEGRKSQEAAAQDADREIEAITKQARSKMPEAIDSVLRAITE